MSQTVTIYEDPDGVRWVDIGDDRLIALEHGKGLLLAASEKWVHITKFEAEEQFGPLVEVMRPTDTCTHSIKENGHCDWWACPNYVAACSMHAPKKTGNVCTGRTVP